MKGTTFRLIFPPVTVEPQPVASPDFDDLEWQGSGRILVIDDEESVRLVSAKMLRGMGFEPVTADDGQSGLTLFAIEPESFVGVLLDLNMPRMDGAQTFTALRQLRPNIDVVLISGYNERDAISRFAREGLSGFLQKPFTPRTLSEVLRPILEPNGAMKAISSVVI
jgi:CheY-like chemotaxis protein